MSAEELILHKQDNRERNGPIPQQRHEVIHNRLQLCLSRDGQHSDDDGNEQAPNEARHGVEIVAQQLQGEAAAVVDRDVVAQHGEGEHDEAELGPGGGVVDFVDEPAERVVGVGVGVRAVLREEAGDADGGADGDGEGGGDHDAEPGEEEDFPGGRVGGVVAVVVGGDGTPAGGIC